MKAFLLAAGVGSRLRPLTDTIPKCLVPIRGEPLLGIWLKLLENFGITEVLVNAHANGAQVREFLRGRFPDHQVTLAEEPELLGSAGTLVANRSWIGADPSFLVLYADVLTNVNLENMLRFHAGHPSAATLGVYHVPDPGRCGIAVLGPLGRIEHFVEKPTDPPGNLAFSGILIGTQALLEVLPRKLPADIGFDVLPRLAGRMFAYPIPEFLLDIGTMENYRQAQSDWPGL
ncbi:MAG: NDP-sugar synthase [Terriglobia bacterium]